MAEQKNGGKQAGKGLGSSGNASQRRRRRQVAVVVVVEVVVGRAVRILIWFSVSGAESQIRYYGPRNSYCSDINAIARYRLIVQFSKRAILGGGVDGG